jgi:hypothetical protein
MSVKILEYVGAEGIIHTDPAQERCRLDTPLPGDIIDFGEGKRPWPYNNRFGTVDAVPYTGDGHGVRALSKGKIHICCEPGSVFLGLHPMKSRRAHWSDYRVFVSISGGPFQTVDLAKLEWSGFGNLHCWNWGNNSPGAHQGVQYLITRPVFTLKP